MGLLSLNVPSVFAASSSAFALCPLLLMLVAKQNAS
jgi:hypothetical protein